MTFHNVNHIHGIRFEFWACSVWWEIASVCAYIKLFQLWLANIDKEIKFKSLSLSLFFSQLEQTRFEKTPCCLITAVLAVQPLKLSNCMWNIHKISIKHKISMIFTETRSAIWIDQFKYSNNIQRTFQPFNYAKNEWIWAAPAATATPINKSLAIKLWRFVYLNDNELPVRFNRFSALLFRAS